MLNSNSNNLQGFFQVCYLYFKFDVIHKMVLMGTGHEVDDTRAESPLIIF